MALTCSVPIRQVCKSRDLASTANETADNGSCRSTVDRLPTIKLWWVAPYLSCQDSVRAQALPPALL